MSYDLGENWAWICSSSIILIPIKFVGEQRMSVDKPDQMRQIRGLFSQEFISSNLTISHFFFG